MIETNISSGLVDHFRGIINEILSEIISLDPDSIKLETQSDQSTLTLRIPKDSRSSISFCVVLRKVVRPSHLSRLESDFARAPKRTNLVVASPQLSDSVRVSCRERGWGYIDAGGNCFLSASTSTFHVVRGGRPIPALFKTKPHAQRFELSTDRETKVVRAILRASRLGKPFCDRDVLKWCENSPSLGYICKFLRSLLYGGYLKRNHDCPGFRLKDPVSLMRDWAHARATSRDFREVQFQYKPSLNRVHKELQRLPESTKTKIAFSTFSALPEFDADGSSRLYLRAHSDVEAELVEFLQLSERKAGSNLSVLFSQSTQPLANLNGSANAFHRTDSLQTYADLLCFPEGERLAHEIFRKTILPVLQKAGFNDSDA